MHRNFSDALTGAGYVTDITYPETFFRELSPVWLNYVAALGQVPPPDLGRPFSYLELGCGLGTSAVTHAAAFPQGRFHACDINRAHIEHARERAAAMRVHNIDLAACAFEDLLREPLPAFDFIVAHGVYSWVAASQRRVIRTLVREFLKPGGLLYLSYNSLPGWASEMPLRKLLVELAAGAGVDTATRTERALRSLQRIGTGRLRFMEANPACAAAIAAYTRAPTPYVAHEFLNETWEPFYGVDVADQLQEAGVAYVGSATLADNHAPLLVDASTLDRIGQLPEERQRRIALDFATNQQFRRDVFWRPTSSARDADALDSTLIGCVNVAEGLRAPIRVPRGIIHFQETFLERLRQLLEPAPLTIVSAVAALARDTGAGTAGIRRNLLYLLAAGALMPFAKPSFAEARPASIEHALRYSIEHRVECVLPSEVLGSGIRIGPAQAAGITRYLAAGSTGPDCEDLVRQLLRLGVLWERSAQGPQAGLEEGRQ